MSASADAKEVDPWIELNLDDPELQKLLDEPLLPPDKTKLRTNPNHAGFDNNVGDTWIYPSNLPCRAYQLSITQAALYRNTLVVLPTGLGKTFIAAVVMYNIYRWYPTGKVIFIAPTRPLVTQQIQACQQIMPFPTKDTVELTGKLHRARRTDLWHSKRVFFATPQAVQSDIMGANGQVEFPFADIKLLVVDEAHRAKGRYATVEVAQAIQQRNPYFRVLALSATPGRTVEDVAEVVRNLFISHLEVRWDNSIDVMQYVHHRKMKTVVVPLGNEIKSVREQLLQILDPYERQLIDAGVLSGSLRNINRNFLLYEQKRFRAQQQRHPQQSAVSSNFSICISLHHALELLERHGLRVFLNNFEADEEGRSKFILNMDGRLRELVTELKTKMGANPFDVSAEPMTNGQIAEMPQDLDFGHPKFEHARSCLLQHFQTHENTRAIVFCEYRESVMLIYRLLLQHKPLLQPRCFVGQGGTTGPLRALSQKQQMQIMQDFRTGKCNILIATSIGEEGIDVGEVDFIVCFDISTSNPTRFVQRIGRTGRKKQGNVVMLVTEGREQQLMQEVLMHKDQTNKKLLHSTVVKNSLYQHSPRLVPTEYSPQCVHSFVQPPVEDEEPDQSRKKVKEKTTTGKNKNKVAKGKSQDLRNFFKKPLAADEVDIFEAANSAPTQLPGPHTQAKTEKSLDDIKDFFKDLEMPMIAPPSSQKFDPKRIRKINRLLKSTTPLVPYSKMDCSFLGQLKSAELPHEWKMLLLKMESAAVRKAYEQMKILKALDIEEEAMSVEELEIRGTYEHIISLLGDVAALDTFLEEIEYEKEKQACATEDYVEFEEDMSDTSFEAHVDKMFEGFHEHGPLYDNTDHIQEEFKKTQRYQLIMAEKNNLQTTATSIIYDTMFDTDATQGNSTNWTITDSKYCSQWEEFSKQELPHKSTPLQGPLMHAYERQRNKLPHSNFKQKLAGSLESEDEAVSEELLSNPSKRDTQLEETSGRVQSSQSTSESLELILQGLSESLTVTPKVKSQTLLPSTPHTTMEKAPQTSQVYQSTAEATLLDELDIDLAAFMEPFPEEILLAEHALSTQSNSGQNKTCNNLPCPSANINTRESPDIFCLEEDAPQVAKATNKPHNKPSLAAKLAAKCLPQKVSASTSSQATPKSVRQSATLQDILCSPRRNQLLINSKLSETSPSIFDAYRRKIKGDERKTSNTPLIGNENANCISPAAVDETVIARTRIRTKRKVFDSDSEQEQNQKDDCTPTNAGDSDSEEIAPTQPQRMGRLQERRKRRRLCAFIHEEAAVSGDSDCEDDNTLDHYAYDSVVVSSDDTDDAASTTHMQAMYLQSLKSPQKRHGAFKIPDFRFYNDQTQIYSQAVPVEMSQYKHDSFVVPETEEQEDKEETTLCPLEQAELILKQRRRAKRELAKRGNQRRRVCHLPDSSEDDFE